MYVNENISRADLAKETFLARTLKIIHSFQQDFWFNQCIDRYWKDRASSNWLIMTTRSHPVILYFPDHSLFFRHSGRLIQKTENGWINRLVKGLLESISCSEWIAILLFDRSPHWNSTYYNTWPQCTALRKMISCFSEEKWRHVSQRKNWGECYRRVANLRLTTMWKD